jgi:hypothetical protein
VLQPGNLCGGAVTAAAPTMQEALALCDIPVTNCPTFRGNDKNKRGTPRCLIRAL